jgi:hypothetical protein
MPINQETLIQHDKILPAELCAASGGKWGLSDDENEPLTKIEEHELKQR